MDATELVESVRSEKQTELSRLGSSKALYAATGGQMDAAGVLGATADADLAARETFEAWAEDDGHSAAAETFASAAGTAGEHYRTVVDEMDGDHDGPGDPPALQRYLRDLDGSAERAGGLVGYALARNALAGQVVGFFVGEAKPGLASTFREVREGIEDQLDAGLELLGTVCESEDDWERAEESALGAVAAAYEEQVESLEAMGVDPKPVC